jgi:hypothetical protein
MTKSCLSTCNRWVTSANVSTLIERGSTQTPDNQQRQTLTQVFASWSLAQALELVGTSQWGQQQPANLFLDVFREVSKQIVFNTEPVVP